MEGQDKIKGGARETILANIGEMMRLNTVLSQLSQDAYSIASGLSRAVDMPLPEAAKLIDELAERQIQLAKRVEEVAK